MFGEFARGMGSRKPRKLPKIAMSATPFAMHYGRGALLGHLLM